MISKRIMLLIAVTVLLTASATVPALALLPNGQQAPNFQLNDLSGNSHKLSDYRGKVVVIDFFGWACSACISDAKTNLVPLYNTYYKNDAKVQFISVEVNNGSSAQIRQYLQETGVPWLVLSGGSSLVSTYSIASTPTLYVIDPAGNVALGMEYPTNVQTLKSTIDSLESSTTPVASAPAACAQGTNLALFAEGADNALYWKHWDGTTWSTSTSLGGNLTSSPAATSPSNGVIDVFARGSDGALWSKNTTNGGTSWTSWHSLSGQLASGTGPAACAQNANSLDVFVQGTGNALWHKSLQGSTWSAWESLGGNLTSSPAATSPSNGVIDVFARGTDGALWSKNTTNGGTSWTSWHSLSGQLASGTGPAACAQNANSLDVFVQGTGNALWHKSLQGSTWSAWGSLGGNLTSSPAATSPSNGVIDVFARGSDGALWQKTYNNRWSGWTSVGAM